MSQAQSSQLTRQSAPKIRARKGGEPIVCLTAYTTVMAEILDPYADLLMVGDSLANVIYGHGSTLPVSLDTMILHAQAVMRAKPKALVVVDLPFGSYESSKEQALASAVRVLKETGADAVKFEGGTVMAETIAFLTSRAVPVMGHVGLLPQSARVLGGYKLAGRDRAEWPALVADAKAVAAAGAFGIVIEKTVEELAAEITKSVPIPTIGIGASPSCDGQILVVDDMLGMFESPARFVRRYANLREVIGKAAKAYSEDVRKRRFPAPEETYPARTNDDD
ncbi:MAG: 3-methyl-2-oxobutanoate hydroxymethyltransferase [Alphaproteobacteria bacterium]